MAGGGTSTVGSSNATAGFTTPTSSLPDWQVQFDASPADTNWGTSADGYMTRSITADSNHRNMAVDEALTFTVTNKSSSAGQPTFTTALRVSGIITMGVSGTSTSEIDIFKTTTPPITGSVTGSCSSSAPQAQDSTYSGSGNGSYTLDRSIDKDGSTTITGANPSSGIAQIAQGASTRMGLPPSQEGNVS